MTASGPNEYSYEITITPDLAEGGTVAGAAAPAASRIPTATSTPVTPQQAAENPLEGIGATTSTIAAALKTAAEASALEANNEEIPKIPRNEDPNLFIAQTETATNLATFNLKDKNGNNQTIQPKYDSDKKELSYTLDDRSFIVPLRQKGIDAVLKEPAPIIKFFSKTKTWDSDFIKQLEIAVKAAQTNATVVDGTMTATITPYMGAPMPTIGTPMGTAMPMGAPPYIYGICNVLTTNPNQLDKNELWIASGNSYPYTLTSEQQDKITIDRARDPLTKEVVPGLSFEGSNAEKIATAAIASLPHDKLQDFDFKLTVPNETEANALIAAYQARGIDIDQIKSLKIDGKDIPLNDIQNYASNAGITSTITPNARTLANTTPAPLMFTPGAPGSRPQSPLGSSLGKCTRNPTNRFTWHTA